MRRRVGAPCRRRRDRSARGRATAAGGHGRTPGRAGVPVALILILSGPPGAGKTTVARVLARRRERSVHLPADWFFEFVEGGFVEPWRSESHEQNEVIMGAVAAAADRYAKAGYFTIVEGIVIPRWFLEPLRADLSASGHDLAYAIVRAPLEVCRARVDERGGEPLGPPEVVENIWREFADVGEWEGHVIEVGQRDPEAVADELASRLEAGELFLPK